MIRAHLDRLFELVLQHLVAGVLGELHIVLASVHTRALLVWSDPSEHLVVNTIDTDLVLEADEAAFRQAFGACEPLDELWSEGGLHLGDEAQEIIIATALLVEAMVGFDRHLQLAQVLPLALLHCLPADHILDLSLGREGANAVQG